MESGGHAGAGCGIAESLTKARGSIIIARSPRIGGRTAGRSERELTLGIPGSGTMALFLGALMMQGISPGPQVMTERPALFWGLIASMWIGNLMLVILNLPLIGLWTAMLKIPYRWLYPGILVLCCIGVSSINNSTTDVLIAALFGVLGYVFVKLSCEPAPFILGFVLGPMLEENLRRAMLLSRGDPSTFVTNPISAGFLLVALAAMLAMVVPVLRRKKNLAIEKG